MDLQQVEGDSEVRTRLAVLLFTDIVGSTALKGVMGSGAYSKLLWRHNELFEKGIAEIGGARIVKHTGDGYFAEFPTASAAVEFALLFQSRMRLEIWGEHALTTRVGIHAGEMVLMRMAGQDDIVGLTADLAARIMGLATGGQILMTAQAFNDARQFVNASPRDLEGTPPLKWMAHGRYVFKGNDDPLEVFEVGIENFSPLTAPPDGEKARRSVPHEMEPTLGWRPAVGLRVPGQRQWLIERRLGEGGFGEVWLARHERLKEERVFKFCFDVERLRSFKRELTLFRLLRGALGDRKDIAQLYEVKLDEAPFYLESEHTAGGSLADWSERNGGVTKLPPEARIQLVADVADAVAAAHSVGVLHKDIKPGNILIEELPDGSLHPKLADFGIGVLSDKSELQRRQITDTGLTIVDDNGSSRTGTRMYAPPELLTGRPFTTKGDLYALGVLLYQLTIGDLSEPLSVGWERRIPDDLIREDIAACVDGDPTRRLTGAADLANRLRQLASRRTAAASAALALAATNRRQRFLRRTTIGFGGIAAILATGVIVAVQRNARLTVERNEKEVALKEANVQKAEAERQRAVADKTNEFLGEMLSAADPERLLGDQVTVLAAIASTEKKLDAGDLHSQPESEAVIRGTVGRTLMELGRYTQAERPLHEALAYWVGRTPASFRELGTAQSDLSVCLTNLQKFAQAAPLAHEGLANYRKGSPPDDPSLINIEENVANTEFQAGDAAAAETRYRGLVDKARELAATNTAALPRILGKLADVRLAMGDLAGGAASSGEALAAARALAKVAPLGLADALAQQSKVLWLQRNPTESESAARESLELYRGSLAPDHDTVARAEGNLAAILVGEKKLDEARKLYAHALATLAAKFPDGSTQLADNLLNYAVLLASSNDPKGALEAYRSALAIRERLTPSDPQNASIALRLIPLYATSGRRAEADALRARYHVP